MSPSGLTRDTIIDHTKTGKALTLENFKRPYKIAPSFFQRSVIEPELDGEYRATLGLGYAAGRPRTRSATPRRTL